MNYLFSPSNNIFYAAEYLNKYGDIPDAVEVSDEVFAEFSGVPPSGKVRAVVDGMPAWGDLPPPSYDELKAIADNQKLNLRTIADGEISWRQDAVDAGIATDEETALLDAWKNYRVQLMRIDTSKAPDIEWPATPSA